MREREKERVCVCMCVCVCVCEMLVFVSDILFIFQAYCWSSSFHTHGDIADKTEYST